LVVISAVGIVAVVLGLVVRLLTPVLFPPPDPEADLPEGVRLSDLSQGVSQPFMPVTEHLIEALRELLREIGPVPQVFHVLAQGFQAFGKTDVGELLWKHCLELDTDFLPAYSALAELFASRGEHDEAIKFYEKTISLDPDSPVFPAKLACEYMAIGKVAETVELLERYRPVFPSNVPILAMLGQAYVQRKEYSAARNVLERVIQLAPEYTNAYYGLAQAATALGDRESANRYLEVFQRLKKQDEQAHRDELKTLDDLKSVRRRAAQLLSSIAAVYLAHNLPERAEKTLQKALDFDEQDPAARELLAWLYHRQGRAGELEKMLGELSEESDRLDAQLLCGALYTELGKFQLAEKAYQSALRLASHQPAIYRALAEVYLRSRANLIEARKLALYAVDLEPSETHLHLLATVCTLMGDSTTAQSAEIISAGMRENSSRLKAMATAGTR